MGKTTVYFSGCWIVLALWVVGLALWSIGSSAGRGSALAHFGGQANVFDAPKRSSAIALTSDGATLITVNSDSNSITMIDTASLMVIAEIPVGVDPRTVTIDDAGGLAYVTNRGSDQVTVIDLATHVPLTQIPVGDRPYGVVISPDGMRLYVAEQGSDALNVIDTSTLKSVLRFPTDDLPSGLAISGDGRMLYITHLLTGIIHAINLDMRTLYLPIVANGSATNIAGQMEGDSSSDGDIGRGDNRLSSIENIFTDSTHKSWSHYIQATIPLWADSNLSQAIVIAPDGGTAYIPHTRSNTTNIALTFDTTVFPLVSLVDLKTQQHLLGQQLDLGTLDPPGVGLPFDADLTPDGSELWVVNAASNDLSVLDLDTRTLTAHIEVGDNPRGITISASGARAYVNNTLAGTVSVLDTNLYTVTDVITATNIPLPTLLLRGKILFNTSDDARMSNAQWVACNTCHFDGEHDGRTWFFGFAGPRNTTSLLGMIETYPLRWSGEWNESADAEFANRKENFGSGLVAGDMNCTLSPPDCVHQPPNQGRSYDLDALAAFMDSLQAPLSPNHAHGEPLNGAEFRGRNLFSDPSLDCVTCHPPPHYTDHLMHNVGTATIGERIGPAYDSPSLRNLFNSAPYFHDGSAETLFDALTRPSPGSEHDLSNLLSEEQIQDLIAFLLALPYE